jgi:GTP1/Obg family GTP-binding protein
MLTRFFQELIDTFPEERDIKAALETIQGARKINPGLVRDMFYEHVTRDLKDAISREDDQAIIAYARQKISNQFNEILPALAIFDKHWGGLSENNRSAIWKYLKVLIAMNEKARSLVNQY